MRTQSKQMLSSYLPDPIIELPSTRNTIQALNKEVQELKEKLTIEAIQWTTLSTNVCCARR